MPHVPTGDRNVTAFPIEGPMKDEFYRLKGMTPEERAWRKQWLQDQVLTSREPVEIPNYEKMRYNPIRRFYRWPLDKLGIALIPFVGRANASQIRWFAGKIILSYVGICTAWYYLKYNQRDWTSKDGWRMHMSKPKVLPGDPGYPYVSNMKPHEYVHEGFNEVSDM